MGIVVYTSPEILLEKLGIYPIDSWDGFENQCGNYYWELANIPKRIEEVEKIYFAVKGYVLGFFEVNDVDGKCINFESKSWQTIKPIETKQFQGFKYFKEGI